MSPLFFDDDQIALPYVKPLNLVFIVQGSARHSRPGYKNRFEFGHRRQRTQTTNLPRHAAQPGLGLHRRKFVGNRPAWRFGRRAQLVLNAHRVDFHHYAVGIVVARHPLAFHFGAVRQHLIQRRAPPRMRIDRKTRLAQPFKTFPVRGKGFDAVGKQLVAEHRQPPTGNHP